MDWDRLWFPGAGMLRRRIVAVCGPATQLLALGPRLADWVEYGSAAPPATVAEVEPRVAGYFANAARAGSWFGAVVGIVAGNAIAAVLIGVVVWVTPK
jgi:hypothetical protein